MNQIALQLNRTNFKGGDIVDGVVELNLATAVHARGIRVALTGYEKSKWAEGTGKHRRIYSEKRPLIHDALTLFGKPKLDLAALVSDSWAGLFSKDHYEVLAPGVYQYPFSFTLPPALPSDYISLGDSRIYYQLKAYVDLPLKIDIQCIQPLKIYDPAPPSDAQPVSATGTKSTDAEGRLTLKAALDQNVFYAGQTIACRVEVINQSGKTVKNITVRLDQVESLSAEGRAATEAHEAGAQTFADYQVLPGQNLNRTLNFPLPADLYPTIVSASLIHVAYQLVIVLEVAWAKNLELTLPIVVVETAETAGEPPPADPDAEPPIAAPPSA